MPPAVCKFWQQGTCRNGDRCRFLHQTNTTAPTGNRFAPLQAPDTSANRRNTGNTGYQGGRQQLPYSLDRDQIVTDLSGERPQWILSAYGPGKNAPAQLFGGQQREKSFEEIRLAHYIGLASGNPQQAAQEADRLYQASEQQIRTALSNVDGAMNFIVNAEKDHPNRIDICNNAQGAAAARPSPNPFTGNGPSQPIPAKNPFGGPSQPASTSAFGSASGSTGAFGQPTALGAKPSPFGAPSQAFGAPSQLGTTGAFGQPSALGQKSNPFGAPSGSSAPATSGPPASGFSAFASTPTPFSQQNQTPSASPFGAPPQAATSNAFGAPTQPATTSAFGAPTQPATTGAFGTPSQPATTGAFGAPSQPAQPNSFGSQPQLGQSNPFGQPSAFASNTSQPVKQSPFGVGPSQQQSPFGAPSSAPTAPNPFNNAQLNAAATSNPFGGAGAGAPSANPFGTPSQPIVNGHAGDGSRHPPLSSYATKDGSGRLTMFKGKRVIYRDGQAGVQNMNGTWAKIWFPEGAPPYYKDTEMEDEAYDENTKAAYLHMGQTGMFQNGVMPLVPPKREWCSWDF